MPVFTLDDGAQLRYREVGSGRPLLLVHGWGVAGACFEPLARALEGEWRLVVPDLRGHGDSPPIGAEQGFPTLVEDVAALIEALDLREVVVVGWSMGALLAWALTQHDPQQRLAGLVTIDMVPRLLNDDSWPHGLRAGQDGSVYDEVARRMLESWPSFTRIFVPRIFAIGTHGQRRELAEWLIRMGEGNDPSSMARLWRSMVEQDLRDTLRAIELPSLVVYGEQSQLYKPAASEWVAAQLPAARLRAFARSGHAPHLEEPEKFIDELLAFLASVHGEQH